MLLRRSSMFGRRTAMSRRWATMPRRRTTMLWGWATVLRRRAAVLRRWATVPRRRTAMSRRRTTVSGRRTRWRMMLPMRFVVIPGASPVVAAPVRSDRERDDRQTDCRAIRQQRYVATLVRIVEIPCVDPPALILQRHVTPCVPAHTTHHGDRHAAGQLGDHRIILRRSRIEIHGAIGVSLGLRRRHARQDQHPGGASQHPADYSFSHCSSVWSRHLHVLRCMRARMPWTPYPAPANPVPEPRNATRQPDKQVENITAG